MKFSWKFSKYFNQWVPALQSPGTQFWKIFLLAPSLWFNKKDNSSKITWNLSCVFRSLQVVSPTKDIGVPRKPWSKRKGVMKSFFRLSSTRLRYSIKLVLARADDIARQHAWSKVRVIRYRETRNRAKIWTGPMNKCTMMLYYSNATCYFKGLCYDDANQVQQSVFLCGSSSDFCSSIQRDAKYCLLHHKS